MIGRTLGPFEVVAKLGEGGMGEVYRARDTKLDRDVAVKVLPDAVADDPERLARFEREAKSLAVLNHPHIAQIYGLEHAGPMQAIVMELVEGEDLAARIARGRLPLDEALAIARQVADALDAAHEKGIVHRDLKPANLKVTPDGTVKVLDFGLAKAMAGPDDPASGTNLADSPTLTARATRIGMILGTAAYMSPEQAKGRPVDKRADIWAFGAVLFEMLAGRRAFDGDDVSDVLAAVIKGEAVWHALPADTPAAVRRLLERCLERDPKRRLRDIVDGMLQLDEGLTTPVVPASASPAPVAPWRRVLPVTVAVVATASVTYALTLLSAPDQSRADLVTFSIAPEHFVRARRSSSFAISHDGRHLAYFAAPPGSRSSLEQFSGAVFLRSLGELESRPLRGADSGVSPFFSPDDEWVGFLELPGLTRILRVPIGGGASTPIAESPEQILGADWGLDDQVVFGTEVGLYTVAAGGGVPERLTVAESGGRTAGHFWPSIVPGAAVVLFVKSTPMGTVPTLAAVTLETGAIVDLGVEGIAPRYLPTGHILYATTDGALRAVPFDLPTLRVTGRSVPLVTNVQVYSVAHFTLSESGTLVYLSGGGDQRHRLAWVDREGRESPIAAEPREYFYPRVSPDGTRVAVEIRDATQDVWIWDVRLETLRRLTSDPGPDQYPVWTPDGRRIAWSAFRNGRNGVSIMNADGTSQAERLADSDVELSPNAITPDGAVIARTFKTVAADTNLVLVSIGDGDARPIKATGFIEQNAALSPDGRWLAFQENTSGRLQVAVCPFPNVDDGSWQVSTTGGRDPIWSADGGELFYVGPDTTMMRVAVGTSPGFSHEPPERLFDASAYELAIGRNFDLAPDGRFLMVKPDRADDGRPEEVVVVLNWPERLKTRMR